MNQWIQRSVHKRLGRITAIADDLSRELVRADAGTPAVRAMAEHLKEDAGALLAALNRPPSDTPDQGDDGGRAADVAAVLEQLRQLNEDAVMVIRSLQKRPTPTRRRTRVAFHGSPCGSDAPPSSVT